MSQDEWIHLTPDQIEADPDLGTAVRGFHPPPSPAGDAAAKWLRESALHEADHIATYVLVRDGAVAAFYSVGMSEVELRTEHRRKLTAGHPRQGAVLIVWLARAGDAKVGAETILAHAVGIAQIAARHVGAAVIALDPYDATTEKFWRERFGFRASRTRRTDADGAQRSRLWRSLGSSD